MALAATVGAVARAAEEACVACHPDVRIEYAESVHAGALTCTGCHGGDPTVTSRAAHAPDHGYVGAPPRADVPRLCGSCHADAERMRPHGLPTDQLAQYRTSRHGVLLAAGDTRVAVCTDCHGVHRIVAREEPTSPVAPRNVPATCGRCHADAALMAAYGKPADQLLQFRESVHGQALLVDDHPVAPSCATCHGAHGANPPVGGTIATVCGHCHGRIRDHVNAGPHGRAAVRAAMAECVDCHGAHAIVAPDPGLFATTCPSCHASGTPAATTARELATLLTQARAALAAADDDLTRVAQYAPTVARYRPRLLQAHAYLVEALPIQHALDVARVEDLTRTARSVADEVRSAAHAAEQEHKVRWLYLALGWAFLLFVVVVAILRRRELRCAQPEDGARS